MLSRMTGDDGPAMLMGIDLFQKGINSDFQGLRNDFNLKKKKRWYLIFLSSGMGEKIEMKKTKVKIHSLD